MARARSLARSAVGRIRQDRGLGLLTAVAMAILVIAVYILVVVGGGAVMFGATSPSLVLSVLATAIVAIAFEPARRGVRRVLSRILRQDRMSPYQVLTRFPSTVTGSYPADQLPLRMARVLAEGTAATRAEVWLAVCGRLELAAAWPPAGSAVAGEPAWMPVTSCAATAPGQEAALDLLGASTEIRSEGARHSLPVRERGELLGALTVVSADGLTPVEERLFAGLAAQSGLMLRVAGLRADLERQLAALEQRTAELREARRDLLTRQDAERQRLERNIHDGAQQEVLALLVNLRLAQTVSTRAPERAAALLAEQVYATRATIATLTALSQGLFPRMLTERGPVAALAAVIASGPIPVTLTSSGLPRLSPAAEAAVYFCALEGLQNATKHSGAGQVAIDIRSVGDASGDRVELRITDDGRGFSPDRTGDGLRSIRDRIESLQGAVTIASAPGRGTRITAGIPMTVTTLARPDKDSDVTDARRPVAAAVGDGGP
jgi:signal transduction histidine kinase